LHAAGAASTVELQKVRCLGDFPDGARRVKVLMDIDRKAFWNLFVKLMTTS
jgi:hypothetical protein